MATKLHIEIAGVGRTRAEEKWNWGLVDLAVKAAGCALDESSGTAPTAVVAANALGAALGDQQNLGAFVSSRLGLGDVEAYTVSTDEASGGSALRLAAALIESGQHDAVLAVGAEKTSDTLPDELEMMRATGLDAVREAGFGFGPLVASALGMRRYLDVHGVPRELFYHLAETAHRHAATNPLAFFPWPLGEEQYRRSPVVAAPLTVCDNAPLCDGAAAVLVRRAGASSTGIKLLGSSSVSGTTGIAAAISSLELGASKRSAANALAGAGVRLEDVSLFELHDSSAFLAALSIESIGLAAPGCALRAAAEGAFHLDGRAPMWTFGGLKARGNAPGAAGLYQVAEAVLQLRGVAKRNQVQGARTALVQCLGSLGATAVTHVLG
ncbi:MAG: thiolase family protein [Proteobacteria bacterium]|jgi:acetyl-CoA C-acetyltransferase|nr:thiolase family protein [Pseudomonadota bacterium]